LCAVFSVVGYNRECPANQCDRSFVVSSQTDESCAQNEFHLRERSAQPDCFRSRYVMRTKATVSEHMALDFAGVQITDRFACYCSVAYVLPDSQYLFSQSRYSKGLRAPPLA